MSEIPILDGTTTAEVQPVTLPQQEPLMPQFTAEHWQKVPRKNTPATVAKINYPHDDWVEYVMAEGMVLRRLRADISQLITAGTKVQIETIGNGQGQIVTGMFVIGGGWAFRMTAQDLADYTRELSEAYDQQQRDARKAMVSYLAVELIPALEALGVDPEPEKMQMACMIVATTAVSALERAPQR